MRRVRTAILISGRGSNMAALIEAARAADYPAEIALVISNNPHAKGLARAREAGVAAQVIPHPGKAREAFDAEIDTALRAANIELVCLAGFMRILSDGFVRAWDGRLINIHPSLLPAFKGVRAVEQALQAGVAVTGCTVHFVVPELDAGPIIDQAAVRVEDGDTAETLAARIQAEEHRLYPEALRKVAASTIPVPRLDPT